MLKAAILHLQNGQNIPNELFKQDLMIKGAVLKAYNVHVHRELFKPCPYVFLFVNRSNVNASERDEIKWVYKDKG